MLLVLKQLSQLKKKPDAGILTNYDVDDYSQGFHQIKEALRALTKRDILKSYLSDHDFRSSNAKTDDVGYTLYVFDIHYQQNFTASLPTKVEFVFNGVVHNDIYRYAIVLANKLESTS